MASVLQRFAALLGLADPDQVRWGAFRYSHLVAYRSLLVDAGYAPATVNKHLAALRGVLREAWRLGQLPPDAYARLRDVAQAKGERLPAGRALTTSELSALFAACVDGTPVGVRDAVLFALLCGAGLRRAEAVSLSLASLDRVLWNLVVLGKGGRERLVPLSAGPRAALEQWLPLRGRREGPLVCRLTRSGLVLADCPLDAGAVAKRLLRRVARARLRRCSPHDLRRTFVTRLLEAGADLSVTSALAGHRQVQTTVRYDRRAEHAARAAVNLVPLPFVSDPAFAPPS